MNKLKEYVKEYVKSHISVENKAEMKEKESRDEIKQVSGVSWCASRYVYVCECVSRHYMHVSR